MVKKFNMLAALLLDSNETGGLIAMNVI